MSELDAAKSAKEKFLKEISLEEDDFKKTFALLASADTYDAPGTETPSTELKRSPLVFEIFSATWNCYINFVKEENDEVAKYLTFGSIVKHEIESLTQKIPRTKAYVTFVIPSLQAFENDCARLKRKMMQAMHSSRVYYNTVPATMKLQVEP